MTEIRGPIGFIGLGNMGSRMARHVLDGAPGLIVSDVSTAPAQELLASGAFFAESPAEVARQCDVIFLSLPGPPEVTRVVAGDCGILSAARPGAIIVDLSTNSFQVVRELDQAASERDVAFVDAPVSGGVRGARKGTLATMVGCSDEVFVRIAPLLRRFSAHVFHVGKTGMGTMAKLVNNQIFLSASVLVQEGFVLAAKAGLGAEPLLEIIGKSTAKHHVEMAPMILSHEFDNVFFKLAIAAKDVSVALEAARGLGVEMPVTRAAHDVYTTAIRDGLGDKVFYATLKVLEDEAGAEVSRLKPVEAARSAREQPGN